MIWTLPLEPLPESQITMTHTWRLNCRLPERKGMKCRVLAHGKMGTILIEFADGVRHFVGWRTIRRIK